MPTQAPNTTTGAEWRARYCSEFYDVQGRHWRVEFIDNDINTGHNDFTLSTTGCHEVELTDDGFVLSYDGPTDHIGGAIIPSSCRVTFILTTQTMEDIHSAIIDGDDERFGIAVYLDTGDTHWTPYWVGSLNHEAIEYETQDLPNLITLQASCGLNRLRNKEFIQDNGEPILGKKTLAEIAATCIRQIPTFSFWLNAEEQMKEVVDIFHEDVIIDGKDWTTTDEDPFTDSVMERTLIACEAFSEQKEGKEDEFGRRAHYPLNFDSCFDVLESISNAFQYRIFMTDFAFWFFPANAYNWSHTLRVQKWTAGRVGNGDIRTHLSGGEYVLRATSEDVNFRRDIEAEHALGLGWTNSYLLPVKRCTLTHLNSGQRSVIGSPKWGYLDYPSAGPTSWINNDIVLSEGETLNVRGTYKSGQLRKEFGSALTNAAFNDYGGDRIGAYIIVRLKIAVNVDGGTTYYYVSEYNQGDDFTIDLPAGYNGDLTNPTFTAYQVGVDDPVWTTSEGWFDVIVPWTSSSPTAPTIDHSDGNTYVGGLHLEAGDDEFEYHVNGTQQNSVDHSFNITTAPLPDNLSSYDGVNLQIDRLVLTHNHNVKQSFPDLQNIFTGAFAVNYDHNDNDLGSNYQSVPNDQFFDLFVGVGSESEDSDVTYFVEVDKNTEFLELGDTVIQSGSVGNAPTSAGSPEIISKFYAQSGIFLAELVDDGFHSITDTIDQDDEANGRDLLTASAREQLYMRNKPMMTQRGDIVPQAGSTTTTKPFDLTNIIHHNCSTIGDVEDYLLPMTMSYVAGTATHSVDAILLDRQTLSVVIDFEVFEPPTPSTGGTGGGPVGPYGHTPMGKGSTSSDPVIEVVNVVNSKFDDVNNDISVVTGIANAADAKATSAQTVAALNATSITNIESKTDHISISQAVDLDDVEQQANRLKSLPSSPPSNRMVMVNSSGTLDDIADGSNGQVLTTNGSGTYSFTTVSGGGGSSTGYVVASTSGQIDMTSPSTYYYGGNRHGWDTDDTYNGYSGGNLSAVYTHSGIALPTTASVVKVTGSVANTTRAEDIEVHVFSAARPNGSTQMTLTSLGSDTVSTSTASGRHYDLDIRVPSLSLSAGTLLFVMFYRRGRTTGSTLVNFTYSVHIEE